MTLKKYILEKKKTQFRVGPVYVDVKDAHRDEVDLASGIKMSLSKIPKHLLVGVKSIKVGDFEYLNNRDIQGMYKDGEIFLANNHKSTEDLIDDIVHEVAHSVEDKYWDTIYSDGLLEQEFLKKRKQLWLKIKKTNFSLPLEKMLNVKYDRELDRMFYINIGYDLLRAITFNIFYSPYASTSLREYFANSFEAFYMKEQIPRLKKISPVAYAKNVDLLNLGE